MVALSPEQEANIRTSLQNRNLSAEAINVAIKNITNINLASVGGAFGGTFTGAGGVVPPTVTDAPAPAPEPTQEEQQAEAIRQANIQNIATPTAPAGTTVTPVTQQIQPGETLTGAGAQLGEQAPTVTPTPVTAPEQFAPAAIEPALIGEDIPQVSPEEGTLTQQAVAQIGQLSEEALAQLVQGTLPPEALVTFQPGQASPEFQAAVTQAQQDAINFPIDPRASMAEQYRMLTDFEAGEIPNWAKGAVTTAQQNLAARGITGSSIAAGAITGAVLKAALPIAQQDAQFFQTMSITQFNARQAATMLKASHLANLDVRNLELGTQVKIENARQAGQLNLLNTDIASRVSIERARSHQAIEMQNLSNRQQAAITNAQSFLSMDMANLNNRQQASIINNQNRIQTMFSDQSATNAAAQFNASSENQINEFFAQMATSVSMFNAGQQTSVDQFNSNLIDSREQFNAQNSLLIEQANVQYLRQLNTLNTANENQVNLFNAQNLLGISNTAIANELTLLRDNAAYAFDASQNEMERAMRLALAELQIDSNFQLASIERKYNTGAAIGGYAMDLFGTVLESVLDKGGKKEA